MPHPYSISSFHSHSQVSTQVIKPHASPPSSDQENPCWQAQPQSSIKHLANKLTLSTITKISTTTVSYPSPATDPQPVRFGFFSFCEQNLGLGLPFFFFFFLVCVCVCFIGGIFRFANFIYGFAKFLGFVGFFVQISLLDLGIHLDGKKIAKKILWLFLLIFGFIRCMFCDDLWFWARVCGPRALKGRV